MKNHRNTIVCRNRTNVHGQSDGSNSSSVWVFDSLSGEKGASSIGNLDDDRRLGLFRGFEYGVGSRGTKP
jgi:hypothetical protein